MNLPDYRPFYDSLQDTRLSAWLPTLEKQVHARWNESNDGHLPSWLEALSSLPPFECNRAELNDAVRFAGDCDVSVADTALRNFHPWRKGPLQLGGVNIDTEWRSDWKWNRLKDHIDSLEGRTVFDIGCGNGYYLYRMIGAGAKMAIGIDPFLLFVMQYWAVRHFAPSHLAAWVLPLGWEDLPAQLPHFDTLFSMGVLYHRRDPAGFLRSLHNYVRPGGQLVMETLVIEDGNGSVLIPEGRYAKMRNVWYIPSVSELQTTLADAGWVNLQCIDVSTTTVDEQRSTEWMTFESLPDYLDPEDSTKTIEGYPAPMRAIVLAHKPTA